MVSPLAASAHASAEPLTSTAESDPASFLGRGYDFNGSSEQVVYAPDDGYTYVAWARRIGIELCVLQPNTTSCQDGGPMLLTDPHGPGFRPPFMAGILILPVSGEVVVLGVSDGTKGTLAWASPEGGAAFLTGNHGLQNSGEPISPVIIPVSPDSYAGNAVALSATDIALLDDTSNHFSDSPYDGPETPASLANANVQPTSPDYPGQPEFSNTPSIAAEATPGMSGKETVVAVGDETNDGAPKLAACHHTASGTGYGVQVGTVGGTGPGTLNSLGIPDFTSLACDAEAPSLAGGGGAGIGVLEQEGSGPPTAAGSDQRIAWRPFHATSAGGGFGRPVELQDVTRYVKGPWNGTVSPTDVSEDSGDGVYASWMDQQGLVLDYSADGGARWDGPVVLTDAHPWNYVSIAGVGGGIGEITFQRNYRLKIYVQTVDFANRKAR